MSKFCFYRDHLCYVEHEYPGNIVDLVLLAEPLVGGGFQACECAREKFMDVIVEPYEMLELTEYEAKHL